MKKINKKGFTIIEILAVILIMGIIMLVAIPAISGYIKSSKEKVFIDTVKKYYEATKRAYDQDKLVCSDDSKTVDALQIKDDPWLETHNKVAYAVSFSTDSTRDNETHNYQDTHKTMQSKPYTNYKKLIGEGEGLSSLNKKSELYGYVIFEYNKTTDKMQWYIRFSDSKGDGIKPKEEIENVNYKYKVIYKNSELINDPAGNWRHYNSALYECTLED